MISAKFLWGNLLLREELQIDAQNSNFEKFENTYMESLSMHLSLTLIYPIVSFGMMKYPLSDINLINIHEHNLDI